MNSGPKLPQNAPNLKENASESWEFTDGKRLHSGTSNFSWFTAVLLLAILALENFESRYGLQAARRPCNLIDRIWGASRNDNCRMPVLTWWCLWQCCALLPTLEPPKGHSPRDKSKMTKNNCRMSTFEAEIIKNCMCLCMGFRRTFNRYTKRPLQDSAIISSSPGVGESAFHSANQGVSSKFQHFSGWKIHRLFRWKMPFAVFRSGSGVSEIC